MSIARLTLGLSLAMSPLSLHAQQYPAKAVKIITAEVGGGHDFTARLVAKGLSTRLGQSFVVENHPGAVVSGGLVAKAAPDGYTLLIFGAGLWLEPLMGAQKSYDLDTDFAPIGLLVNSPILVATTLSLPVKSVKELIAMAKSKPGDLNYGSGQAGNSTHLSAELFKSMAGVDIVRVPYKGTGPATQALVSGQVQVMFPTAGSVAGLLKAGKVRPLAITSAKPSPLFPDLPTVAADLPGYSFDSILGAFAPAKTSPAIVATLSKEMNAALNIPEIKQAFSGAGIDTIGSSPQVLADLVKSEQVRLGKVIKDLGIKLE